MQWKISASEKASAVEQQYEDLRDRLDELGDFGFLDEIQDDNMHQAEMPFPYGSQTPRPYGWYSMNFMPDKGR